MAVFLKNFVRSKTFKALLGVIAAAAAAYASSGCAGLLAGGQSARVARFNCQVDALQPVLGDVMDTADLVRSLYAGNADLGAALSAAGATEAEVRAVVTALRACEPAPPVPADAGLTSS